MISLVIKRKKCVSGYYSTFFYKCIGVFSATQFTSTFMLKFKVMFSITLEKMIRGTFLIILSGDTVYAC